MATELEACSFHLAAAAKQTAEAVRDFENSHDVFAVALRRRGWDVGIVEEPGSHELLHGISIPNAPEAADSASNQLRTAHALACALSHASGWNCQAATVLLSACLSKAARHHGSSRLSTQ